jgi:hypothetical protein
MTPAPVPPTSRYHGLETATLTRRPGETIVYFRRRFVPPPERFETLEEHRVSQGERPDTLAARFLGDPEQAWRMADANGALRPEELTGPPGRIVRITLPEGLAAPHA